MKPLLVSLLIALGLSAATPQEEVRATVETWKKAMIARDGATLDRLYHKDLMYEHSSGKTETKAEAIEGVVKTTTPYVSIDFKEPSIRVFGNTALLKGIVDIKTSEANNHLDCLMVFLKTGSGWQLVGRQTTKLP